MIEFPFMVVRLIIVPRRRHSNLKDLSFNLLLLNSNLIVTQRTCLRNLEFTR